MNNTIISGDLPTDDVMALLKHAKKDKLLVSINCSSQDKFSELAWHFGRENYLCTGMSTQENIYHFAPVQNDKQRILITATQDNFHFMQPVMRLMREQGHYVTMLSSRELTQQALLDALKHCDVAWFEWGDGAIIPASKMPKYCRIVCRIHRYELYGEACLQVNWDNIDEVILVSQGMKKRFLSVMGKDLPPHLKVTVLANLTEHIAVAQPSRSRNPWHIACVARFAPQKNLIMLLPIMQALVKKDARYKLFIAGRVEDACLYDSFCELIAVYGLSRNITLCGALPASEMPGWYADKSFLLSSSYNESQGMGIFEGMLMGLKPVAFHATGGLAEYLPTRYLFTDPSDAVEQISQGNPNPGLYVEEALKLLRQDALPAQYTQIWQPPLSSSSLFSIVIPCYNRERFLLPAVYSALSQRDEHIEVVVVDDGSTDNSLASLAHFDDPRLRIIRKDHTNAPDTRNRGIAEARGEFLVWLDSDDLLHPNSISHYRTLVQRWPQVDVISCGLETFEGEKQFFSLLNHPPAKWLPKIAEGNFISNPGCCVRRALYNAVGQYNTAYLRAHDYEFWSRAVGSARIAFSAQCNIAYRLHDNNLTGIGKPVDATYEYRIFEALVKCYRPEQLFPGKSRKAIDAFVKTRREKLIAACSLESVTIVLDAITQPLESVLEQIQKLGAQQDKCFQVVIVSSKPLPFAGLSVVIADSLASASLREHLHQIAPQKYCRAFSLQSHAPEDPKMITALKDALLKGTPVAPHLQRLCL
ncbi:glycosyltransferase [Enterobacter ludwigii]|uniref:glycosyltransferase n=1 Tax=Enterobacter ludwigii TaxID=299767 RepID=UPI003F71B752